MHEPKISMSAKGKAREDTHWQLGWWDVEPLVNSPARAIAWSRSSVIFTPHTTQPLVMARHFPSSRQFILPSPAPWSSVPGGMATYAPPSIISVSPSEDLMFAYFPGHDGDGAGCLWKRGDTLDSWTVQEWWSLAKGAGVVAADWLSGDRDWIVADSGNPYRLPPRGPSMPFNSSSLLIYITQAHQVHVCMIPPIFATFKILKASLSHFNIITDNAPPPVDSPPETHGGRRVCTHAAIGTNYNDATVFIATRSHLLPTSSPNGMPFNTMDLGLHLDMHETTSFSDSTVQNQWEQWGEESTIELYSLIFRVTGVMAGNPGQRPTAVAAPFPNMAMRVMPTLPIKRPGSRLTGLRFCAVPPEIVPPSPTITRDPRRPAKDGITEKGSLYLLASFLDFADYTSLPKSEISSYAIRFHKEVTVAHCSRSFENGTIAFLSSAPSQKRATIGFLEASGTLRRHARSKEVPIGSMALINPLDLSLDDAWETARICSPVDGIGRDIPGGVAVSPNGVLICSISPAPLSGRTAIHSLPRQLHSSPGGPPKSDLARALVSSMLSRKSPSDIIHALSSQTTPLDAVFSTLYNGLSILEVHSPGMLDMWLEEMLGVAAEVFHDRSKRTDSEAEKQTMSEFGKTVHDITSVASLNTAFEDCREEEAYDLSAVWQLVGLSLWFIDFLERLLKQCVYVGNEPTAEGIAPGSPDKPSVSAPAGASILLNLLHPFALGNIQTGLAHVKRFRDDLNSLSPKTENAQMAKDVLMDGVDGAGVHLNKLEPLLQEIRTETQKLPADELKRSIISCTIRPPLQRTVRQSINRILTSDVINRTRLFIKPSDLIDGVTRLSVSEQIKEQDSDVISKGVLLHTGTTVVCVRCGSKSELKDGEESVAGHVSMRWKTWERMWRSRCVCGGAWIRPSL